MIDCCRPKTSYARWGRPLGASDRSSYVGVLFEPIVSPKALVPIPGLVLAPIWAPDRPSVCACDWRPLTQLERPYTASLIYEYIYIYIIPILFRLAFVSSLTSIMTKDRRPDMVLESI